MVVNFFLFIVSVSFATAMDAFDNLDHFQKSIQFNFMWLNEKLSPDQEELFPMSHASQHVKTIVDTVALNKNYDVEYILWYDGQTTMPENIEKTQNTINELLAEHALSGDSLYFKDVRDIAYFQQYSHALDARHPIYFKTDLARVGVLLNKDASHKQYKVYADLNIPPIDLNVHAQSLSKKLNEFGFALSKNNAGDMHYMYENAFLVLDITHQAAVHAFQFAVLDMNRMRAEYFLEKDFWNTWTAQEIKNKIQIIFTSFKPMFSYYRYLMGEYGIEDDQKNMPETLEKRIARYQTPTTLFGLDNGSSSKVSYKHGKDEVNRDYVGYQLAGKIHQRTGALVDQSGYIETTKRVVYLKSLSAGSEFTVQIGKPISSFY